MKRSIRANRTDPRSQRGSRRAALILGLTIAGAMMAYRPTPAAFAATTSTTPTAGQTAGFVADPNVQPYQPSGGVTPDALPASVSLSQYNPPVGNQNPVNSCTAWAVDYGLLGWYANRDGYYPSGGSGGFEPMYTYAQIVQGSNGGTSFSQNLNIMEQQGVDSRADYTQGDYNYTAQPTAAERLNATKYNRIVRYTEVGGSSQLQNWIEGTIAGGNPVAVGFPIYPEFRNVSAATNYIVYPPSSGETSSGGHAVFASSYDANGLWIENSWGTGYGKSGYAELSWSFVNQYVSQAVSIVTAPMKTRFQAIPGTNTVYVLGSDGNLWRETGSAGNRNLVDGHVAQFQAVDSTTVYVLGTDGNLWAENGNSSNRGLVDGNVASFQDINSQEIYVLGSDGKLWRENGNSASRTFVDGNVVQFQGLMDSMYVFVLGTDGHLWREYYDHNTRFLVDGNVRQFQAIDQTTVYVLGTNGNLWHEIGNYSNRTQVDAQVAGFEPLLDGSSTVYVQSYNGNLWREYGNGTPATWVDGSVAAFQALDGTTVFVLGTNGNLWHETGTMSNRFLVDSSV